MYRRAYFSGSGNIDESIDPGVAFQLEAVRLHLPAAGGANNFTVSVVSAHSDAHNLVLETKDMSSATDDHYQPTRPVPLAKGDKIALSWTNGGGLNWGLEVIWSPA